MLCGVVDKSLLYILDTIENRTYNHPLNTLYILIQNMRFFLYKNGNFGSVITILQAVSRSFSHTQKKMYCLNGNCILSLKRSGMTQNV